MVDMAALRVSSAGPCAPWDICVMVGQFNRAMEKGGPHVVLRAHVLLLGLVAAALGFAGIAGVATQISWVLFVVGVVLLIIHVIQGRSPRGI